MTDLYLIIQQYNTIQYNTIQYNTIQYNTIQYNTIQYNTIQYNTIQYNTIRYDTIRRDATRPDATQRNAIQYNTTPFISNIEHNYIRTTISTQHWDGWKGKGLTEEEYYRGPSPTLINSHCQCKIKQKMKETKCKLFCKKTKIRIFKSNVLSVLLYVAESWKVTKGICHMREVFQNNCLRRILHIFWPNKITNAELHERTGMLPISLEEKKRRWRWIGHVNRMPLTSIPRVAMRWTPAGNWRRGRPKETWRRSMEREMKALGWSWGRSRSW